MLLKARITNYWATALGVCLTREHADIIAMPTPRWSFLSSGEYNPQTAVHHTLLQAVQCFTHGNIDSVSTTDATRKSIVIGWILGAEGAVVAQTWPRR